MRIGQLDLPADAIADVCRKHHVRKLALFGSALRDDFRSDSDVDLLVEFDPSARIGMIEYLTLQDELAELVRRPVDLVSRNGLKPRLRDGILSAAKTIYAN